MEEKKKDTVTFKKNDLWRAGTFVFAALFVVALMTGGFNFTGNVVNQPTPSQPQEPTDVKVEIEDNDPVLGNPEAKVSVVEFSDFQCPFCTRAATQTVAGLKESQIFKDGEVNFVFKQFPLNSIHPDAQDAAEASLCALDQGKFFEYHDVLFANQQSLGVDSLKAYAQQIGLDTATFNDCLDSNKYEAEVNKETQQAVDAGGRGTPYFVVVNNKNGNTQAVSGAVPFAQLEAAINAVM